MRTKHFFVNDKIHFPQKKFLNLKEAAEYLGRSPLILRRLANDGVVPCQRFQNGKSKRYTYFFTREALDSWASGGAVKPLDE